MTLIDRYRRGLIRGLTAVLLALLAGCGSPDRDALPTGGTILAFGDSLTAGVGAPPGQSYPDVLAELTGLRVVNAGISGETTIGGRNRLPRVLDDTNPDLLILLQGGNDILRNQRPDGIKANLAAMIELAERQGVTVVLLGVPEKKLFSDSAPLYAELAADFDVIFDDDLLAGLLRSPSYKSDPIHLNARGYAKLAEEIHDLLANHGLVPRPGDASG